MSTPSPLEPRWKACVNLFVINFDKYVANLYCAVQLRWSFGNQALGEEREERGRREREREREREKLLEYFYLHLSNIMTTYTRHIPCKINKRIYSHLDSRFLPIPHHNHANTEIASQPLRFGLLFKDH